MIHQSSGRSFKVTYSRECVLIITIKYRRQIAIVANLFYRILNSRFFSTAKHARSFDVIDTRHIYARSPRYHSHVETQIDSGTAPLRVSPRYYPSQYTIGSIFN